MLINTSVLKNEREKDEEKRRKKKKIKKEKKRKTTKTQNKKNTPIFILSSFFFLFLPYFFRHFLLCTAYHLQERTRRRETEEEIFYFFSCGCPMALVMWLKAWSWRQTGREIKRDPEKREKNLEKYFGRNIHTGRNTPKSTETAETHRNTPKFFPRWNGGCLVPVCVPVRDFPSVPAGTERNIQLC